MAQTPGPWGIEQTADMLWVGPLRRDDRKVETVVVGLNIDRELTQAAALRQYQNARLIAAAPELLAAAQWMEEFIQAVNEDRVTQDQRDLYASMMKLARDAISKAEQGA